MLQENPEPGLPYPSSPGEVRPALPKPATRLLTGSQTLTNNGAPQRLLAYDPARCDLQVFVTNTDTGTSALANYSPVLFSSDVASLGGESVSAVVNFSLPNSFRLAEHNGELWAVLPTTSTITTVKVSWIATTR